MKVIMYWCSSAIKYATVQKVSGGGEFIHQPDGVTVTYFPVSKNSILNIFKNQLGNCRSVFPKAPLVTTTNQRESYPGDCTTHAVCKIMVDKSLLIPTGVSSYEYTGSIDDAILLSASFGDQKHYFHSSDKVHKYESQLVMDQWQNSTIASIANLCYQYANGGAWRHNRNDALALSAEFKSIFDHPHFSLNNLPAMRTISICLAAINTYFKKPDANLQGDYFAMLMAILGFFQTMEGQQYLSIDSREQLELLQMKLIVANKIDNYISQWKFSLFGHHHNQRAEAVIQAVLACDSLLVLKAILQNQSAVVSGNIPNGYPAILDKRWSNSTKIKHTTNGETSGYEDAINDSLKCFGSIRV